MWICICLSIFIQWSQRLFVCQKAQRHQWTDGVGGRVNFGLSQLHEDVLLRWQPGLLLSWPGACHILFRQLVTGISLRGGRFEHCGVGKNKCSELCCRGISPLTGVFCSIKWRPFTIVLYYIILYYIILYYIILYYITFSFRYHYGITAFPPKLYTHTLFLSLPRLTVFNHISRGLVLWIVHLNRCCSKGAMLKSHQPDKVSHPGLTSWCVQLSHWSHQRQNSNKPSPLGVPQFYRLGSPLEANP